MHQLFLVRYPEEPIAIPSKGKTAIGRSEGNDIILTEPRVSRKHAAIGWMRFQRAYSISDLGSSNGTFLNGSELRLTMRVSSMIGIKSGSPLRFSRCV